MLATPGSQRHVTRGTGAPNTDGTVCSSQRGSAVGPQPPRLGRGEVRGRRRGCPSGTELTGSWVFYRSPGWLSGRECRRKLAWCVRSSRPIGATLPLPAARSTYQKARQVEKPAPRKGRLTARPSGKFWIPIPMARFLKKKKKTKKAREALGLDCEAQMEAPGQSPRPPLVPGNQVWTVTSGGRRRLGPAEAAARTAGGRDGDPAPASCPGSLVTGYLRGRQGPPWLGSGRPQSAMWLFTSYTSYNLRIADPHLKAHWAASCPAMPVAI